MNIAAEHVSPEDVMAFVDGELSPADAQAVSAHVEHCTECSRVAEQLRRTSDSLSVWKVPPLPMKVEQSIAELEKAKSASDIGKPNFYIRASFWGWKQYAAITAGAVSALVILVTLATPNLMRPRVRPEISSYLATQRAQTYDGVQSKRGLQDVLPNSRAGDRDRLAGGQMRGQLGGRSSAQSQFQDGEPRRVGQPPRIAADSNGLFHGLGDHAQGAFSVDGQPATDQQSKVFSNNGESAPMIARTVSLAVMVKDFASARSSVDMILARYRGYAAQLNVSTNENAPRSLQASLRIPAAALSSAVNDLKALGRVQNEWQSGEEVTRHHADLVARLKNSRETEQRLRDILQQRTGKITDVLKVEEEIARVRGEIESMEGEQRALEHRVDFATIELQLSEEYKAQLNPPAPSVSNRIHNAFVAGYQNASETVLGILLFFVEEGPVLVMWLAILALPFILVWRRYRRIRATV